MLLCNIKQLSLCDATALAKVSVIAKVSALAKVSAMVLILFAGAAAQTSPGVLERAVENYTGEKFETVIQLLEPERSRAYPSEALYRLLASAYLMTEQHKQALDVAEEGVGHYPRSPELHVLQVDALSNINPDLALEKLDRIIRDLDIGELYSEHFSRQEFQQYQARIHSLAGRTALQMPDYARAISHFETAADLQPFEPAIHHQLLYAHLRAAQFEELLAAYDRAPAWLRDDQTMITLRSQALLELQEVGELSVIYRKLYEENPDDLEHAMTFGQLLLADNKILKANELFNELIEKNPENRRIYDVLMDVNRRQFNYDGQAALLERMIRVFPEDVELSMELARLRELTGNRDKAVAMYDSLIQHRGPEYRFFREKAALLYRADELDKAYATIKDSEILFEDASQADSPGDAASREPDDAASREPDDAASRETDDAASREPDDAASRETDDNTSHETGAAAIRSYDLALLSFQQGDAGAAAPLIRSYLNHHPQDSLAWMLMGRVQEEVGAATDALSAYQRAEKKGVVWPEMFVLMFEETGLDAMENPVDMFLRALDRIMRDIEKREDRLRLMAQFTMYGQPVEEGQPFYPMEQQLREVIASLDRFFDHATNMLAGSHIRQVMDGLMEIHPDNARVYNLAARYFEKSGDPVLALQFYMTAAEINPNEYDVHLAIAGIMEEREDWGSAVLWYERALSARAPSEVYGSLIRVHRENGSLEQLVDRWLVRYRSQRTDPEFREYLIDALHRSGRREEAREIARQR